TKLMGNLKKANIDINRKMLAEIAVSNPEEFTKLVELANQAA
ncbi:MAG: 50S ribosomal protein L20, partial [Anaerococcus obesiensis]